MVVFQDKVKIECFQYNDSETYFYPYPCGYHYKNDQFMCGETVLAPSTNKELVK
ncbi:DPH3 homolog [Mastomys coucha]|uniref:DPH3 homolog n=1 Tax=Mastomys coucha TaxID=35658 RepID=UPI001261E0C8|nr:DPH3 homolog [Mastomys coucha]